ncbi:esterase/lipase family protein [Burkholderia sp. IMCC1007]|uniref:esterase/lipase family protein n=1 Tax=Burkholderia sp. IMCC1007 TaxID=3004104 RepID=UPI0022B5DDC8|nr:hypothetical protein [Burkholderia sp. IMCC1007]
MTTAECKDDQPRVLKQARRRVPLQFDENGDPYFESVTSPESFPVRALCQLPPPHVIPVIFVPGIMGTLLCGTEESGGKDNKAWYPPNGIGGSLIEVLRRLLQSAAERQKQMGPNVVQVDNSGPVKIPRGLYTLTEKEAKRRGWGEVHLGSYGAFLAELELALNDQYLDAENISDDPKPMPIWQVAQTFEYVRKEETVDVRKQWNPVGVKIEPLTHDEFMRLDDYYYPVWACGYNWLASNGDSADQLINRINEILAYYNKGQYWKPTGKVIIVTHSMGGLVGRRAAQKLAGMGEGTTEKAGAGTILGVVHGVQPVGGAPIVYRRFRAGTEVHGFDPMAAGLAVVVGWSAASITCVMANSPGPLELLPTKHYEPGWLRFKRAAYGKQVPTMPSLPIGDPYSEIYSKTTNDAWWGMIDPKLINPADLNRRGGITAADALVDDLARYKQNLEAASDFHEMLGLYCHDATYAYYGADKNQVSYGSVTWSTKDDVGAEFEWALSSLTTKNYNLQGKVTLSHNQQKAVFRLEEGKPGDIGSAGDGTVPVGSGQLIAKSGESPIVFRMDGFDHQYSYNNENVRNCVMYCIGKIVQLAPIVD